MESIEDSGSEHISKLLSLTEDELLVIIGRAVDSRQGIIPPEPSVLMEKAKTWLDNQDASLRRTICGSEQIRFQLGDSTDSAILVTAIGTNPIAWVDFQATSWVRFVITVRTQDGTVEVFDRTLSPQSKFDERGWFDVAIPLERWTGQEVEIELQTQAEWPRGTRLELGGWTNPRIVTKPVP